MTNLVEKIKNHLKDMEYSQNHLSQKIGIAPAALSSYLNGNYKGNNQALESKLEDYFKRFETAQKEFVTAPDFVETLTSNQIFRALDFAQIGQCINVIYGASGVGKTRSITEYAKQNSNVFIVTASPSRATLSEILYELALEIGINDAPKRSGANARLIRKKLKNMSALVIIDEADHLPYNALEELRIIQEETGVGMVLVGNDKVYNRLRGASHQSHEFARLWSRIAKRLRLQSSKKADVLAIAAAWGLDEDKECLTLMREVAQKGGGLRSITQALKLAAMAIKGKGGVINAELLTAAVKDLQGVES